MPLNINPLAQLVAQTSESVSRATNQTQSNLPNVASAISKAGLDSKVNSLAGGLGSGLNGLTGSAKGAFGQFTDRTSAFGTSLPGASALGNIGGTISSSVGGAINTLQNVAGSTSNITADISGAINKLTGGNLAGGLQQLAGQISSAAGVLNNILSIRRAVNLPSGAEAFIKQGSPIKLSPNAKNDWRVRITCQWDIFNSPLFSVLQETGGVVWPYLPNITVSTKADYTAINTVHSNYTNYAYKGSMVDDIQISGEFSCETETDAAYWIAATTFFKTATKMFFGQGEFAGNPPLICNLTGYGSSIFDKVPVIIKSFSVDLKDDVNYVRCNAWNTNTWVPVLSTISVTVSPVYNRQRLRQFSLQDYARGKTADPNGVGYI